MASSLPLLLVPRPQKPTTPHFHSRRLAPPPQPASLSAPAAIHPRKAGRLAPLHVASGCNPAAAAATTGGGGFIGAKDWRLLAWYLMALDKHPVATKAVTYAVLTLAGDLICHVNTKAERERKRAIAARAKAQGEEYNTELGRKGKWPCSKQ